MDAKVAYAAARLRDFALLSCEGDDARAFLHAQLTSDVAGLGAGQARRAGWCSAKGRLLATLLVIPHGGALLLQLSRDLAPAVAKRLQMFILRAKVKLSDATGAWTQFGLWGPGAAKRLAELGLDAPRDLLACTRGAQGMVVCVARERYLVLAPAGAEAQLAGSLADAGEESWALQDIRDGLPRVVRATQEQFVPQMVNLERLGAVDFQKGCYPGQEIVARTQYRGALKRRMVRARVDAVAAPGDELHADDPSGQAVGAVVNAAAAPEGGSELLAVVQISVIDAGATIRLRAPDGPALALLPLP
jgi:folate-binding protein YgfZ